jgi:TRAP-type C4-dicarboxylate transport system substrate-binding protein
MVRRKWFLSVNFGLVFILVGLAFMTASVKSAPAKITLKAVSAFTEKHPQTRMIHFVREAVNERAKGRLEIVWAGGPELFKAAAFPEAIATGAVDIILAPGGTWPGLVPEGNIESGHFWKAEYAPKLSRELRDAVLSKAYEEKMKAKLLAFPLVVQHQIVTRKPVTKLAELKGLSIRGTPGPILAGIAALGATPIRLPAEEVYMAMERGTIDGAVRPLPSYVEYREYEVAKNIISTPFIYSTMGLWISVSAWNKLPADLQKIVFEEGDRMNEKMAQLMASDLAEAKKVVARHGVIWHDLPAADTVEWAARTGKAYIDIIKKEVPKESADKMLAIVNKYYPLQ